MCRKLINGQHDVPVRSGDFAPEQILLRRTEVDECILASVWHRMIDDGVVSIDFSPAGHHLHIAIIVVHR